MSLSIHLEPVGLQHAAEVQKLVTSHPDIVGMTRMPDPYPEDGAATWISQAVPLHEAGEMYAFAIVRDDGQVVGMTGLISRDERAEDEQGRDEPLVEEGGSEDARAEMGYWIGGPFWNKGYATEAVRQLVELAFSDLGFERVFATPLERNPASQRVLKKNGFELARVYPNAEPRWEPTDRLMEFELARDHWAATRRSS